MEKKLIFKIAILTVLGLVLSGCTGAGISSGPSGLQVTAGSAIISQQNTGIWVTGQGKVTVVPDVANLSLGVEAQAPTVSAAQSSAAQAMDAVVKAVKSLGVADNDVKTMRFSITPVMSNQPGKEPTLVGYRVSNMVTVKIRKVGDTGTIIDAVAKAGGDLTRIDNISFSVEDPTLYYKQARQMAMNDANTRAAQLAELGGVKLGKPTYINESGGYVPGPMPYRVEASALAAPTTPISPGETVINLTVTVVYSTL